MIKLWKKRQKRKHLSNLSPHLFCKFSHRVILSRSSFIQTSIFRKNFSFFFGHFQHGIFFINSFYSRYVKFFVNFQITKSIFLKKANNTLVFSIFSSFIQSKTPSYFEKETEWETIFFLFFKNSKHIFLFWQESIFFNFNDVIKFINIKQDLFFFTENHNTRVSALLLTCKRNIRTEVSLHVS